MTTYRISQLAALTGVPATTLRFYEAEGLLPADRTAAGYRVYDEQAVARLRFISSGKHLGLSLEEIAELMTVYDAGVCGHVRAGLRPLVDERVVDTGRRIAELTAFEGFLAQVRENLAGPVPEGACGPECGCLVSDGAESVPAGPPPGVVALPMADAEAPVACTLDGPAMADRVADWRALLAHALTREDIDGGLRITFPDRPDVAVEVVRLAAEERRCCAFYDFAIAFTAAGLVLTVRAPGEAAGLVAELFGESA